MRRYLFAISTGRSGQASLSDLLTRHATDAVVGFEEPQVRVHFKGFAGTVERRFRRRFIETDELLGRGRVLRAFDAGDDAALDRFAAARLAWVDRRLDKQGRAIWIDVSKHFTHGLHQPTARRIQERGDRLELFALVRDPIENMRSYVNRSKTFARDYGRPDGAHNILRLPADELSPGELYLWAWCETYLRGDALAEACGLPRPRRIATTDLNDADRMAAHLTVLDIAHRPLELGGALNTNVGSGYGATTVGAEDIATFERFRDRLPEAILDRLPDLRSYHPRPAAP